MSQRIFDNGLKNHFWYGNMKPFLRTEQRVRELARKPPLVNLHASFRDFEFLTKSYFLFAFDAVS
ncbi:hypothetical protein D3C73_1534760 [compost metagenome]